MFIRLYARARRRNTHLWMFLHPACWILLGVATAHGQGHFPPGTPYEVEMQVLRLNTTLSYSPTLGRFTQPFSASMVDGLNAALSSSSNHPAIVLYALHLTEQLVRQFDLGVDVVNSKLRPLAQNFVTSEESSRWLKLEDTVLDYDILIPQIARRIVWQSDIRTSDGASSRLKLLLAALGKDDEDALYYIGESVRYLVQMKSPSILSTFRERLAEPSASGPMKEVLQIGIRQVSILEELDSLESSRQIDYLFAALIESPAAKEPAKQAKPAPDHLQVQFLVWILETIAAVEDPKASIALRRVLDDDSYRSWLRYEAQRLLVETGVLEHHFMVLPPIVW